MSRNNVLRQEFPGQAVGVEGRFFNVITDYDNPKRIVNQKFGASRPVAGGSAGESLRVELRFDDSCKNGHETFAITGTLREGFREVAGGCLPDEIAKTFPEFEPLIKWHLCSTDGPLHYLANACFLAGDRDHNGLRKGEESTNPRLMEHFVRFGNSPVEHKVSTKLKEFIDQTLAADEEFVLDESQTRWLSLEVSVRWHGLPVV